VNLSQVSQPIKKDKKHYRGLDVTGKDMALLRTIADPKYNLSKPNHCVCFGVKDCTISIRVFTARHSADRRASSMNGEAASTSAYSSATPASAVKSSHSKEPTSLICSA
jgi:hypothetical protein